MNRTLERKWKEAVTDYSCHIPGGTVVPSLGQDWKSGLPEYEAEDITTQLQHLIMMCGACSMHIKLVSRVLGNTFNTHQHCSTRSIK
jgi:hypothetical protein